MKGCNGGGKGKHDAAAGSEDGASELSGETMKIWSFMELMHELMVISVPSLYMSASVSAADICMLRQLPSIPHGS